MGRTFATEAPESGLIIGTLLALPVTAHMSDPRQPAPFLPGSDALAIGSAASFDLLLRAKAGNEQARELLFTRYLPRVRRWAHGRLPAHSRSLLNTDDLAQEVLCRAIVSLEMFEPRHEGAFQGFLRQVMMNRVRDEVRSARRKPTDELIEEEHFAEDPSPMELAIGREALERYETRCNG